MTQTRKLILSITILGLSMTVSARDLTCAQKQKAIETEIAHAKVQDNANRIAGLNKALAEVKAYCTDEGLQAKREAKIKEKEAKVNKAERELEAAKAKKDTRKIAQKQSKLQKALTELAEEKATI